MQGSPRARANGAPRGAGDAVTCARFPFRFGDFSGPHVENRRTRKARPMRWHDNTPAGHPAVCPGARVAARDQIGTFGRPPPRLPVDLEPLETDWEKHE